MKKVLSKSYICLIYVFFALFAILLRADANESTNLYSIGLMIASIFLAVIPFFTNHCKKIEARRMYLATMILMSVSIICITTYYLLVDVVSTNETLLAITTWVIRISQALFISSTLFTIFYTVKDYFKELDNLNNNALIVICYSCSKTFTIYGMRLGASIILHKDEEVLDSISNAYDKSCRTYWSNSNNGAMTSISNVLNKNYNEFIKEKELYINLLKERSDIILKEAKENELPIYPYKEGFFITIKVDNSIKDKYHQELIKENIFTVQVNEGIRVAVCSLPINKCYGLSKRLKDILDKVKG